VVRRAILDDLRRGTLKPGERLGSERRLAETFGVSRSTLRLALDSLERSGMVVRVPGRTGGTFVHESKIERDLSEIAGVPAYLQRQGFMAGTRVISASMRAADKVVAKELATEVGAPIYDLIRVRLANGEPISLEHAMLPVRLLPALLDHPLGGSLMDLLAKEYSIFPANAVERIEMTRADADEARLLGVEIGDPLLSVERTGSTEGGEVFEFSIDLFRADRTRLVVKTTGASREVAHSEDGAAIEVHST